MVKSYQNPIIRGMHPDPSVVRVNDTYYLANSTFEYYPGVTVMTSKDLLNWKTMGGVATVPEQADLRKSKSMKVFLRLIFVIMMATSMSLLLILRNLKHSSFAEN